MVSAASDTSMFPERAAVSFGSALSTSTQIVAKAILASLEWRNGLELGGADSTTRFL